jgi:pimeloyl-ACP methyl ester carboxylesterase
LLEQSPEGVMRGQKRLRRKDTAPDLVLVGHSMGSLYVRVFADLYPKEVAGMVLLNPSEEAFDDWTKAHLDDK